jgi:hypothetical protein
MSGILTPEKPEIASGTPKDTGDPFFDRAWRHFKHHADQRLVTFHFALVVIGATAGGVGYLSEKKEYALCVVASLRGAPTSFLFLRLDRRGMDLIKLSEAGIIYYEKTYSEKLLGSAIECGIDPDSMNIMVQSNKRRGSFPYGFGQIFRVFFPL